MKRQCDGLQHLTRMYLNFFCLFLFTFSITCTQHHLEAQTKGSKKDTEAVKSNYTLIETKKGASLYGKINYEDDSKLIIENDEIGTFTIKKSSIKKIKIIDASNVVDGEYFFPNPNESRYLFAPSAIPMKKGDGYYQNTYVFLNTFFYAFTDFFTLGGGFEVMSLTQGTPLILIAPKLSTQISDRIYIGGGILFGTILNDNEGTLTIGYGIATYGTPEHNITLGVGYGSLSSVAEVERANGEIVEEGKDRHNEITIMIGGMTRLSRRFGLVSENWMVRRNYIISYGIRFMGPNMTVDVAFLNNKDIATGAIPIGIPYVDFMYKF